MKRKRTGFEGQAATRAATLQRDLVVDMDARTFEVSLASETPVQRYHWDLGEFDEVLLCGAENVDFSRMTDEAGAPYLFDHEMRSRSQIGVLEDARIDAARVVRCRVRVQRSAEGDQLLKDVADRIKRNVSVGYFIRDVELHEKEGERPRVVVTRWQPFEGSSVAAGADPTVGAGRSTEEQYPDELVRSLRKRTMKINGKGAAAADPADDGQDPAAQRASQVQISEARAEAGKAERARIREIRAIAHRFPECTKAADQAVEDGTELEDFRAVALDALEKRQAQKTQQSPQVDVPRAERRGYSLGRAVLALMHGDPAKAPLEFEVSRAYEDKGVQLKHGRSIFVPYRHLVPSRLERQLAAQILGMRAAVAKTGEGADLVSTDHLGEEYVPHLLSDLVVVKAGARLLPGLVGDIDIPAGDGSYGTATFIAEAGSASEAAPAMRTVSGSPHTASAYTDFTRKMRLQGVPALEAIVRSGLADSINELVERTALNGLGTGNLPRGVYQTSGVTTAGFGGAPTYANFVEMWSALKGAKGTNVREGFITSHGVAGKSMTVTRGGTGSDRMIAEMAVDGTFRIDGWPLYPTQESPQTFGSPADDHGVAFGDWSKLIIASWGEGLEISVDMAALALSGGVRVISFFDVDTLVTLNKSFVIATDVTP